MWIYPVAMLQVDIEVRYFMNIGNQKQVNIKVMIKGYARARGIPSAGEISDLRLSRLREL
jgi:hypothetical protein